ANDAFAVPSNRTLRRISSQLLERSSPHAKTTARIRAEGSQRNFVSWAAALGATHIAANENIGVNPSLFVSQDFTRLVFGEDGDTWQWVPKDFEKITSLPVGVEKKEHKVVAVSVQAALTAVGGAAPFVIHVKAPNMEDGQRVKILLRGVGASAHPAEFSWLVIDKKRQVIDINISHKYLLGYSLMSNWIT